MTRAEIIKDGLDCVVIVDNKRSYRAEKVKITRLADGRFVLRIYDPAFHLLPRTCARHYHNDHTILVDELNDMR